MKKYNKKQIISIFLAIGILFAVVQFVYAANGEPGSNEDPLVTLSYVEQRIQQLRYYIDDSIDSLNVGGVSDKPPVVETDGGSTSFEVIELNAGDQLIGHQGTEIILRSGRATAIVQVQEEGAGLSDVTGATNIERDGIIPRDHLLIVPRNDGRGVKVLTDRTFFMVRGSYQIKN
ncbi:MAG: hypothetical protein JJT76_01440 [Clostridiaceae bacterium]|nr:hypothetical protein [Clostridiaceae bacterium]